jgi:hypothetical protein
LVRNASRPILLDCQRTTHTPTKFDRHWPLLPDLWPCWSEERVLAVDALYTRHFSSGRPGTNADASPLMANKSMLQMFGSPLLLGQTDVCSLGRRMAQKQQVCTPFIWHQTIFHVLGTNAHCRWTWRKKEDAVTAGPMSTCQVCMHTV